MADPFQAYPEVDARLDIDWVTARRVAAAWALLLGPTGLVVAIIVVAWFVSGIAG